MIAHIAALVLGLQEGWTDFHMRRALGPEQRVRALERLQQWFDSHGVAELQALGRTVRVLDAEEQPVYVVEAAVLAEQRRLDRARVPYRGQEVPPRTVEEVDIWGPPSPANAGGAATAMLPIEGSARVTACSDCAEKGQVECRDCGADGRKDCRSCLNSGKARCSRCNGSGRISCSSCGGAGRSNRGGRRTTCDWCRGSGRRACPSCTSGRAPCPKCNGRGEIACGSCRGDGKTQCAACKGTGRVVESLVIVIDQQPREESAVVGILQEDLRRLVKANDGRALALDDRLEEALA